MLQPRAERDKDPVAYVERYTVLRQEHPLSLDPPFLSGESSGAEI
jgi:hypothetical protein